MSGLNSGYYKNSKQKEHTVMVAEQHVYVSETVDDVLALANPYKAIPTRGISQRIAAALGIRTRFDEFGDTVAYYFPYYKLTDGAPKLVGFKRKSAANAGAKSTYTSIGDIDVNCLLFGAVLRNATTGKVHLAAAKGKAKIIITEGEFDCAACMEAQLANQKEGTPIPVFTSIGFGTANAVQHISARINQEFLSPFETTVIAFDNDCATEAQLRKGVVKGQEALKAVADYLGETNIKVCALPPQYDPNDMLKEGRGRELFWAFTMPKDYSVAGFIEHSQIRHEAIKMPELGRPFPWDDLTKLTLGRRLGEGFYFGAGCVDSETEFLSPNGWVKISDYVEGMKVSQYNPENGDLEFVEPLQYIKAPTKGMLHLKTKYGVEQVLSGEHRFAFWAESNLTTNKPTELAFHEVVQKHLNNKTGFRGLVKTTFNYSGAGIDFTDAELRLQVAIMADGRIVKEGKDNYTQMRFKKKRKYNRLVQICTAGNLKFLDKGINNQGQYEVIVWGKTDDKTFDAKYYNCTKHQLEIIADELPHWDGTIYKNGSRRYFSAIKTSMDFAQFCYSAAGQRCNLKISDTQSKLCPSTNYFATLFINRGSFAGIRKGSDSNGHEIKHFMPEDGLQYCFSVPSTFLILRRNGCVFITGNTKMGKSELLNEMVDHILKTETAPPAVFKFEEEPAITCKKLAGKLSHKQFNNPEKVLFEKGGKFYDVWGEQVADKLKHTYFTAEELEKAVDNIGDRVIYYNNYGAASWDDVADKIRYAVTVKGCKDVFIDPLTRLTAGMESSAANTELERIADAISTMSKDLGFTYYIFCHLKSPSTGQPHEKGGKVESYQFTGSRAMMRACYYMIGLERNKSDELPEIIRNTSNLVLLEDRAFGRTGRVALYYDKHTGDFRQPTPEEIQQYNNALEDV